MPRTTINRLSTLAVQRLKKPGRHADGGNLYLVIKSATARSWMFIYQDRVTGRQREIGLGSVNSVPLTLARERAAAMRQMIAEGRTPALERPGEAAAPLTFGAFADGLLAELENGWSNDKHRYQWRRAVEHHAAPIRDRPIADITTEDVLLCLKPIWLTQRETASRLRQRIERIIDAATAKRLRTGDNPARLKGHLEHLLPKQDATVRNHAAMPWQDVPAFVASLQARRARASRALEFTITTAARTGEVIGATWDEIDLDAGLWVIPAVRMKARKEHRVPLTDRAREILIAEREDADGDRIWPISNMSMAMQMRRLGRTETVHGFRSTFRDWAGDVTDHPREIIEAALAHTIGSATERAYRRSDALERRRRLMEDWATHLASGSSNAKGIDE